MSAAWIHIKDHLKNGRWFRLQPFVSQTSLRFLFCFGVFCCCRFYFLNTLLLFVIECILNSFRAENLETLWFLSVTRNTKWPWT